MATCKTTTAARRASARIPARTSCALPTTSVMVVNAVSYSFLPVNNLHYVPERNRGVIVNVQTRQFQHTTDTITFTPLLANFIHANKSPPSIQSVLLFALQCSSARRCSASRSARGALSWTRTAVRRVTASRSVTTSSVRTDKPAGTASAATSTSKHGRSVCMCPYVISQLPVHVDIRLLIAYARIFRPPTIETDGSGDILS